MMASRGFRAPIRVGSRSEAPRIRLIKGFLPTLPVLPAIPEGLRRGVTGHLRTSRRADRWSPTTTVRAWTCEGGDITAQHARGCLAPS